MKHNIELVYTTPDPIENLETNVLRDIPEDFKITDDLIIGVLNRINQEKYLREHPRNKKEVTVVRVEGDFLPPAETCILECLLSDMPESVDDQRIKFVKMYVRSQERKFQYRAAKRRKYKQMQFDL